MPFLRQRAPADSAVLAFQTPDVPLARGRVVIAEDEPEIREVIAEALSLEGYSVEAVAHGRAALDVIERMVPDVLLLDMRMPILDGWGLAAELKRRGIRVPIVVMTAAVTARLWAAEIGADAYLAKPFDLDDLFDVLERFCRPRE